MRYAKTPSGLEAMKNRSAILTAKQRAALVLCDEKRPREQVLHNLASVGSTLADLEFLKQQGFITEVAAPEEVARDEAQRLLQATPPTERYKNAYPIATLLAAGLGLRGFSMAIAIERATSYDELCAVANKLRPLVPREQYAPLHQVLYR